MQYVLKSYTSAGPADPPDAIHAWEFVSMAQSLSSAGDYGAALVTVLWKTPDIIEHHQGEA